MTTPQFILDLRRKINHDLLWLMGVSGYVEDLFVCRPDPNGNAEPFVGDDESLSVGWFSPDALPEPLAATTVERMGYVREYLAHKASGDAHAQFAFRGAIH